MTALGVMASGRGSNLQALLAAIDRGDLHARVTVVISNNSSAGALELARGRGIPAEHISGRTHGAPDAAMLAALERTHAEVLVLAGYMKKVGPRVLERFAGRAVNIHPAPLPRFGGPGMYGLAVHEAVLAAKVTESGPTVHRVTSDYDEGEVLAHRAVVVHPSDSAETLAARVLEAEHDLYWRVLEDRFVNRR